jgi:hypothetical protein
MNLHFRKEKAYLQNTFWIVGLDLENRRDSSVKTMAEGVSTIFGRPI